MYVILSISLYHGSNIMRRRTAFLVSGMLLFPSPFRPVTIEVHI